MLWGIRYLDFQQDETNIPSHFDGKQIIKTFILHRIWTIYPSNLAPVRLMIWKTAF